MLFLPFLWILQRQNKEKKIFQFLVLSISNLDKSEYGKFHKVKVQGSFNLLKYVGVNGVNVVYL